MAKTSTFRASQSTSITVNMTTKPIGDNYALHYLEYTSCIPEFVVNMLNTVLLTPINQTAHIKKLLTEQVVNPELVKHRAEFFVTCHDKDFIINLSRTKLVNGEITYKDQVVTPLIKEDLIFNHRGENLEGKIFVDKLFRYVPHAYFSFSTDHPRHNEEFQLNDAHFDLEPLIRELQGFTHPLVESLTVTVDNDPNETYRNGMPQKTSKGIDITIVLHDSARAIIRKAVTDDIPAYAYLITDNRMQDCENKVFDMLLTPVLVKYYRNNNL